MALSQEHIQDLVVMLGVPVALSYIWIATFLPLKLRAYLSRRRLRWIEHCRALYLAGLDKLQAGELASAEDSVEELQRWQARWEARQTWAARLQRAFWVILAVWMICIIVKLTPFLALLYLDIDRHSAILTDYHFLAVYSGVPLLISFSQYFLLGYDEDVMAGDDFAGRLRRAIDAGQDLVDGRYFPDWNDIPALCALFGLGDRFTIRELDKARRRLASELHPDRWSELPEHARRTREEPLKNVNGALSGCAHAPLMRIKSTSRMPHGRAPRCKCGNERGKLKHRITKR